MISFVLLFQLVCLLVFALLAVAFFSLFERKLMGLIQIRKGPNKVGVVGILQPIADAMKLVTKVEMSCYNSLNFLYLLSPFIVFFVSFLFWITFPSKWILVNFHSSCIIFLVLYSVSVFGLIFSGWFSNSKYATLGSSRAFVQSISYEVGLTLIIVFLCIFISSPSISSFLHLQEEVVFIVPMSFFFFSLYLVFLAELNRSPFDLSEGESELVSGYSVEYGGLSYTLLFLGENMALIWSSILLCFFFSALLVASVVFSFVWVRATLPRIRFDKMVNLFWIMLLPPLLVACCLYLMMM